MKRFGNEEGSVLVEFAISSTILFMLLFGIMDFSFGFYSSNFTAESAKLAARYASVRGSCYDSTGKVTTNDLPDCGVTSDQIQTFVQNMGFPGINPSNTTVTVTWPNGSHLPGNNVKVAVTYTFPISVPFWKSTQLKMQSTSEMVISN